MDYSKCSNFNGACVGTAKYKGNLLISVENLANQFSFSNREVSIRVIETRIILRGVDYMDFESALLFVCDHGRRKADAALEWLFEVKKRHDDAMKTKRCHHDF